MFTSVLSRIGIIFIILLVGTLARWRRVLTEETASGLCRVAIEITLPFLYFYTLSTNLNLHIFSSNLVLPLYAILLTFASYFLSRIASFYLKLDLRQAGTFKFLLTFSNYGFLAIPLVFALFGRAGLVRVFIFNLGITFLYWTFGIAILSAPKTAPLKLFKNLLNNATVALVLGLIAGIISLKLPRFIMEASNLIGNATIPLALIVVGSMLARNNYKRGASFKIIFTLAFCRLIIMPVLAILFINIFDNLPNMLKVIIVLQAAMPSASTTPILVKRFGGDAELAASGVFFTTLFSIITVPFFISLVLQ
ncbi:MAG: AEC family transporter [Candidatus Omnitrophota bacterium]|nr:MAG: AEC family transporter [Candidatus Omnitrophota bacterium]